MQWQTGLFGDEVRVSEPEPAPAIRLSLFDHAAERAACESGRAVSQERVELVAPPSANDH